MTAALRDLRRLTPAEFARLGELRVHFSGQADVDVLVAEEALDMASGPEAGPCPPWCDYASGHRCDSADGTVRTRTEVIRFHEQSFGDHAMVAQQESCSVIDGAVTLGVPYVLVSADGLELTNAEAERLASCVADAAQLLREIGGAA